MITQIELNKIPGYYAPGTVQKEVLRFHESGWPAAEVSTDGYVSAASCRSAYGKAAGTLHIGTIDVITRKGRVFLIRKEASPSDVPAGT